MTRTIIEGGHVATVDAVGTEHATGHVVIDDGVITQVGAGRAADDAARRRRDRRRDADASSPRA